MTECLFCRIASGEVAAQIVYEDDMVVAFRDINPRAPMHLLIVPRRHVASLADLGPTDEELVGHAVRVSAQLAGADEAAERGFRLVANCGPEAGQSVDHLHFHLLAGRPLGWPPG